MAIKLIEALVRSCILPGLTTGVILGLIPLADLPAAEPPQLLIPEITTPPILPADPAAEAIIKETLQGNQEVSTDIPFLGETLDYIRKRQSVLKGSSLDPEISESGRVDVVQAAATVPLPETPSSEEESSYLAAEALLRSARILSKLDGGSSSRSDLIRKMRAEATNLLRGLQETSPRTPTPLSHAESDPRF